MRAFKQSGTQPLLVFSDGGRSMALMVDEIVDIVEERIDIAIASAQPGLLGSAVIKGQATEVIDVGHFLPLAFEDWLWTTPSSVARRSLLLVDDAPFFRNMLSPVLKAAGYAVTSVGSGEDALAALQSGRPFDVLVTDIEMPGMSGFDLASAVRNDPRMAALPIIGLSGLLSPDAMERGRKAGLRDYVTKFDRQGLIAALKERSADLAA